MYFSYNVQTIAEISDGNQKRWRRNVDIWRLIQNIYLPSIFQALQKKIIIIEISSS